MTVLAVIDSSITITLLWVRKSVTLKLKYNNECESCMSTVWCELLNSALSLSLSLSLSLHVQGQRKASTTPILALALALTTSGQPWRKG